ncbi:hypothetical protein VPHK354_0223 [Vibrio phage K354]
MKLVEGVWVVKEGVSHKAPFEFRPYLVTRVSGKRVYVKGLRRRLDPDSQQMKFSINEVPSEDEQYFSTKKIVHIFPDQLACIRVVQKCQDFWEDWWIVQANEVKKRCNGCVTRWGGEDAD